MHILPYKLDTTNDLLTSRAGLLSIAQLMTSLKLGERIDKHFPLPKSNRGFKPSAFIQALTIEDGGPNDMDGQTNRVIKDPAQIGAIAVEKIAPVPAGGGGTLHPLWLLVVLSLHGLLISHRQKRIKVC